MLKHSGFSLAELLVALAILGVIATFTVPKILYAQADQQRKAIFKETFSALEAILYQGISTGSITDGPSYQSAILNNINAVQICSTDATTQGCWNTAIQGTPGSSLNRPGFVLTNGASVASIEQNLNADGTDGIWVDYNGLDGPNTVNQDQIQVLMCVTGPCTSIQSVHPKKPGLLGPNSASASAYDQLFQ